MGNLWSILFTFSLKMLFNSDCERCRYGAIHMALRSVLHVHAVLGACPPQLHKCFRGSWHTPATATAPKA